MVVFEFAVSEAARAWLARFADLSAEDQQEVVAELVRRSIGSCALTEATLHELGAELFQSYDAEEAHGRS